MAQSCVFCGQTPVTSEHVIGKWVKQLFPGRGTGTAVIVNSDGTTKTYPTQFFDQKVNAVCASCNNGWMSAVEAQAKDKLSPLMTSLGTVKLRPPAERKLATWAVKTALMLQYIHRSERVIPNSEYSSFYTLKQPSQTNLVLIGSRRTFHDRTGSEAIVKSSQQVITRFNAASDHALFEHTKKGRRAYRSVFAVGHVVFALVAHDFPGELRFSQSRRDVMQPIWPIQGRLYWPPPVPIDDVGGFEAVFEGFGGPPAL